MSLHTCYAHGYGVFNTPRCTLAGLATKQVLAAINASVGTTLLTAHAALQIETSLKDALCAAADKITLQVRAI